MAPVAEEMKKLKITFLFFLISGSILYGQQDPVFTQYMFNNLAFNPASSGINNMICASAVSRQQWVGFTGAPKTMVFNLSAPVSPFHIKSGVGLNIESGSLGFEKDIVFSGSYSYIKDVGTGKLGIGINLGVVNMTLAPNWQIPSGDTHVPASGDPLIPETKESYVAFDMGFGSFYRTDRFYAGLSVTHLNEPKIKFTKGEPYLSRHYYITSGYTITLANPAFELLPSVFAYSDGKVVQMAVNTLIRYNKKVWGGVSYRSGDAVCGIVGVELYNGIRVGYSYDFPLTDIRKSTSGTHEFMVNYCFDFGTGKSPMRYKSIRFL